MKKSLRITLTGNIQSMFFENFIKEQADKLNVKGFFRKLEDGRAEIFIEGDTDNVAEMRALCQRGFQHSQVRKFEEKPESFQGFKEFKVLKI